MLSIINERPVYVGMTVSVYRNLNQGELFSIRDRKTGLVAAHGNCFRIENVKCHVGKGRLKVLKERVRNVHSWLNGYYSGECAMDISKMDEVYYSPYKTDTFINKETGEKLLHIDLVYFQDGKCYMLRGDTD